MEPSGNIDASTSGQRIRIRSFHKQTIEEYAHSLSGTYDSEISPLSSGNFSAQTIIVDFGDIKLIHRTTEQKSVQITQEAGA